MIVYAWEDVKAMFNGGTRKRLFSESTSSSSVATPTSTTPLVPPKTSQKAKQPKTEPKSSDHRSKHSQPFFNKKPDFSPLTPAPPAPTAPLGYFPPFDTCLDTFAAAAAALKESEKPPKVGGNGGASASENSVGSSLGISDYGLWPHPPPTAAAAAAVAATSTANTAFPFPYSFFWPSKRPPTTPFNPFHASILGNYIATEVVFALIELLDRPIK